MIPFRDQTETHDVGRKAREARINNNDFSSTGIMVLCQRATRDPALSTVGQKFAIVSSNNDNIIPRYLVEKEPSLQSTRLVLQVHSRGGHPRTKATPLLTLVEQRLATTLVGGAPFFINASTI